MWLNLCFIQFVCSSSFLVFWGLSCEHAPQLEPGTHNKHTRFGEKCMNPAICFVHCHCRHLFESAESASNPFSNVKSSGVSVCVCGSRENRFASHNLNTNAIAVVRNERHTRHRKRVRFLSGVCLCENVFSNVRRQQRRVWSASNLAFVLLLHFAILSTANKQMEECVCVCVSVGLRARARSNAFAIALTTHIHCDFVASCARARARTYFCVSSCASLCFIDTLDAREKKRQTIVWIAFAQRLSSFGHMCVGVLQATEAMCDWCGSCHDSWIDCTPRLYDYNWAAWPKIICLRACAFDRTKWFFTSLANRTRTPNTRKSKSKSDETNSNTNRIDLHI